MTDQATGGAEGKGRKMIEGEPVRRISKPEEIVDALLCLSSVRATFGTGYALVIDGEVDDAAAVTGAMPFDARRVSPAPGHSMSNIRINQHFLKTVQREAKRHVRAALLYKSVSGRPDQATGNLRI